MIDLIISCIMTISSYNKLNWNAYSKIVNSSCTLPRVGLLVIFAVFCWYSCRQSLKRNIFFSSKVLLDEQVSFGFTFCSHFVLKGFCSFSLIVFCSIFVHFFSTFFPFSPLFIQTENTALHTLLGIVSLGPSVIGEDSGDHLVPGFLFFSLILLYGSNTLWNVWRRVETPTTKRIHRLKIIHYPSTMC